MLKPLAKGLLPYRPTATEIRCDDWFCRDCKLRFRPGGSWLFWPGCPSLRFPFGKRLSSHSRHCPFSASARGVSPIPSQGSKDHRWVCAPLDGNCDPRWGTKSPAGPSAAVAQSYGEGDELCRAYRHPRQTQPSEGCTSFLVSCKLLVAGTASSRVHGKCRRISPQCNN